MIRVPASRTASRAFRLAACLVALSGGPATILRAQEAAPAAQAATEPLGIVAKSGRHAFQVEVMRDDAQRARGLMYRSP